MGEMFIVYPPFYRRSFSSYSFDQLATFNVIDLGQVRDQLKTHFQTGSPVASQTELRQASTCIWKSPNCEFFSSTTLRPKC